MSKPSTRLRSSEIRCCYLQNSCPMFIQFMQMKTLFDARHTGLHQRIRADRTCAGLCSEALITATEGAVPRHLLKQKNINVLALQQREAKLTTLEGSRSFSEVASVCSVHSTSLEPAAMKRHCNTNSDCLSAWEVCNPDGVCGCSRMYGFGGGPECQQLTWDSAWAIGTSLLSTVTAAIFFVWSSHLLLKVLRMGQCDFVLSTLVACFISSACRLAVWAVTLAHALGSSHPRTNVQYAFVSNALIIGSAGSLLCAAFNLSLMWAEFIIASKRLLSTGTNLRLTARFLFWYMVVFALVAVLAILLDALWHQIIFTLWTLASIVSAFLLITVLSIYSRKLGTRLLEEATRTAAVAAAERASEETSQANRQRQISWRLVARGKDVIKTTGRLRVLLVLYMILLVAYHVAIWANAHVGVLWLLLGGVAVPIFAITASILSSISNTLSLITHDSQGTALAEHRISEVRVIAPSASLNGEATDLNAARPSHPSPRQLQPASVAARAPIPDALLSA